MTDKAELARRKLFIKRAHDVIKIWPGHAIPRPAPETETDRYMQSLLKTSQELLICSWLASRAGKVELKDFELAVDLWWIQRLRAAGIFGEEV